jgi:hypothetical protein
MTRPRDPNSVTQLRQPKPQKFGEGFYRLWCFCRTIDQKKKLIRHWRTLPIVRGP